MHEKIDPAILKEAQEAIARPDPPQQQPQREGRTFLAMAMVCPHGHAWESEIMVNRRTGKPIIDWQGPLYLDKFCPECSRPGKRMPVTADDLGGLISAEDVQEIGEDAMATLAVLLASALANPEHYTRTSAQEIAAVTVDHPNRVVGFFTRLNHLSFITLSILPGSPLERVTITPGPKVNLVTESGLVTP